MSVAFLYTLAPATAAIVGAAVSISVRPRDTVVSAIQHFAAGVVFAAAAAEILPDVLDRGSIAATLLGGIGGILAMLAIKALGARASGPAGLIVMVGVDIFIDGLVLGIGFTAGAKAGLLLTLALTIEILFLGLTVAAELAEGGRSRPSTIGIVAALAVLLPLGAIAAMPVSLLPPAAIKAFFAFALVALLYLVTEELLVEAHETPDRPWITAAFFIGFLVIVIIEQATR